MTTLIRPLKNTLLVISLLFISLFPDHSAAQPVFHTEMQSQQVPLYSCFIVTVKMEGRTTGQSIKAWTDGGQQILEFSEQSDTGYISWIEKDTVWDTRISDSMVVFRIKALTTGEHTHTLHIDVEGERSKKYSWSHQVSFWVEKPVVSVELTRWPVIYEFVDNPVKISVSGVPDTWLSVNVGGASLNRNNDGYTLFPDPKGNKIVNLRISFRSSVGEYIALEERTYDVHPIPEPDLVFEFPDTANPKGRIKVTHPILDPSRLSIQSWELELNHSGKSKSVICTGNGLNTKGLKLWNTRKPGDSWLVKNVVVCLDGKPGRWILARQGYVIQNDR